MDAQRDTDRRAWPIAAGVALVIVVAVVVVLLVRGDDDGSDVATEESTTTSEPTTTTDEATTTTAFAPTVDPASVVFPDPSTSRRFDDPVALARAFAVDFVGMTDPQVSELAAGDARSGEVEVTTSPQGAPTVVLVRRMDDDAWFVVGATTDSIRPEVPAAGATITSPQALSGQAYAFEGTVSVALYADGSQEPVATTFVTGRGDGVLGDYSGELAFTAPADARYGTVLYTSEGGADGAPMVAVAHRVELR